MGGQAAEKLVLKDISTGASSDLEIATSIARAMVMDYGMSNLGPISVGSKSTFGWMRMADEGGSISTEMLNRIDIEVKRILDEGYKQAEGILKRHRTKLDKVAKALLEIETLDTEEFEKIVGKKLIPQGISTTPSPVLS